jgi:CelD/BcsL family acetyltransferase involved in cellulose biosynthesis
MRVEQVESLEAAAPLAGAWNSLAQGVPFRSWEWLSCWWRHYGHGHELYTLAVFDDAGELAGVAPWYRDGSGSARVVRFLGTGDVCSEYLSVLCRPGQDMLVAETLAAALTGGNAIHRRRSHEASPPAWDLLELTAVDARDAAVLGLTQALAERGCWLHRRLGPACWRVELPPTWDAYLALLSKSHRKQVRRLERHVLDTGRARLFTVHSPHDLAQGLDILYDLHQRRHNRPQQPGCFADERFAAFHREVAGMLLESGRLRLHWLELGGRPVAAEYHVSGGDAIYAYQSGVEPGALAEEPGRLAAIATLKLAIAQGYRAFDFLRGDEPYKAHWRAKPRETFELRTAAGRPAAQFRYRAWAAGQNVLEWAQRGKRWLSAGKSGQET